MSLFKPVLVLALFSVYTSCSLSPRLNNGLALTPPMGWNTYNHYSCSPTEAIVHSNAQALVSLGLSALGYHYVTVDCGWTLPNRTSDGTLTWNPAIFPSGFPALGEFIHGLGLGFGVYSDGGIQMCMTGEPAQAGSLFHEQTDADTFAAWEADLLKYDNCYSEASAGFPDTDYTPIESPSGRYQNMSNAVLATKRPMLFLVCEWGVDFPAAWAPKLGNSWRMSNDIIPAYRTIPRILNQVVPQTSFAGPGQWLDLDMLEVGNNVFTIPEEQTHFSLWAIIKSPLVIGAALKDTTTSINANSLAILMNEDVISYNQDSMGVAASFRRRWTADHEIWAGPLSGGRTVVAVINLQDTARSLTLDLPDVGLQTAGTLKDIWNGVTKTNVKTSYTANVQAHGTILLELGDTTPNGTYTSPSVSGSQYTFTDIYGITTSSSYTAEFVFPSRSTSFSVEISGTNHTVAAGATSLSVAISLVPSDTQSISITSPVAPTSLTVLPPSASFFPSTSFTTSGTAVHTTCSTSLCAPVGAKIGFIEPTGSASLTINSPTTGSKFVDVYFCNNDIAFSTAFGTGTNTRNLTISVNDVLTRIEVPLSGRSSELFSPGLGWEDTGIFGVLLDGFQEGNNDVVVSNVGGDQGLVMYGADFVGLGVYF